MMRRLEVELPERRSFFTPKTLAQYLSLSERSVRRMIAERAIASYRVGGSRRVRPEDVEIYLEQRKQGG